MSGWILTLAVAYAQIALVLAMGFAAWRVLAGPRGQDRVLGLDTLYVNTMLLLVTVGIRSASVFFFEAALVIAMLGFAATVALSKFLMRGEIIE